MGRGLLSIGLPCFIYKLIATTKTSRIHIGINNVFILKRPCVDSLVVVKCQVSGLLQPGQLDNS